MQNVQTKRHEEQLALRAEYQKQELRGALAGYLGESNYRAYSESFARLVA